jgi:lysophospholipase L1-like esterase
MEFAPMHRRDTGVLSRVVSKASPAVQRIELQREPRADFWDAWNADAVKADGPLWVALGDSTSQGIGAADPLDGWIPRLLDRLQASTSDPWRVINLGITGAQFSDIVEHQLPRLEDLSRAGQAPVLVTHLAGANNLMAPTSWYRTIRDVRTILDALPEHSVVARVGVSSQFNSLMARRINRVIEDRAKKRPFHLFWPWDWPSRDGIGEDKWHPGPKGYSYMTDVIFEQVRASLARTRAAET